jgi:hypothetical protein
VGVIVYGILVERTALACSVLGVALLACGSGSCASRRRGRHCLREPRGKNWRCFLCLGVVLLACGSGSCSGRRLGRRCIRELLLFLWFASKDEDDRLLVGHDAERFLTPRKSQLRSGGRQTYYMLWTSRSTLTVLATTIVLRMFILYP